MNMIDYSLFTLEKPCSPESEIFMEWTDYTYKYTYTYTQRVVEDMYVKPEPWAIDVSQGTEGASQDTIRSRQKQWLT